MYERESSLCVGSGGADCKDPATSNVGGEPPGIEVGAVRNGSPYYCINIAFQIL